MNSTETKIAVFQLGPLETNAYLIYNDKGGIVIDPGGDPAELISFVQENKISVLTILNTHFHFDHIQGNAALKEFCKATIRGGEDDAYLLKNELGGGGFMGFPKTDKFEFEVVREGTHEFIGLECLVLDTPGHSPGSKSFYFPALGAVFSGDLVFYRSVGRTDFPGGDLEILKKSARKKIFTLPRETKIYPGHGPETSVGDEAANNPYLSDFSAI